MTAEELIKLLDLSPHPEEGGYYRETYRCDETIPGNVLPPRYHGDRAMGTAIYFLLTRETCSAMHKLVSDEVFHFYLGDPVEMLHLLPDGTGQLTLMGSDFAAGMSPQVVVPGGWWQGARLREGGAFALFGTTVAPGFEFQDYEHGHRAELVAAYPEFRDNIEYLTPAE
jgi:uncharacterized protein